jgi:hypothetical protein
MTIPAYYAADGTLTDDEAWVAVASTTLDADTASITFTSTDDGQVGDFSQYMDLVAICYLRGAQTGAGWEFLWVYCNGDSTAGNYAAQHFVGDGTNATAAADNPLVMAYTVKSSSTISANIFGSAICHFFDINSGKYKSSVSQSASDIATTYSHVGIHTRTWKSQAAITSLLFRMENGNLSDGTMISLFGVLPRMVA